MNTKQQEIKLPTPQRRYNTQNAANRSINSMYQQQIAVFNLHVDEIAANFAA